MGQLTDWQPANQQAQQPALRSDGVLTMIPHPHLRRSFHFSF